MAQLTLFDPDPVDDAGNHPLADVHADAARVAARLPAGVRFGTSSWTFPGWTGLVYASDRSPAYLAREGLREYTRHPLLATVGIDRSYYAPVPEADLRRYATQVPAGFRACAKAPATVMSAAVPGTARGGGAIVNPTFLSAERLLEELIDPFARAFASHTGPFVLECAPVPREVRIEAKAFVDRLGEMLVRLPRDFAYAIELRDRRFMTDDYRTMLASTGASHVYNYWSAMPALSEQASHLPAAAQPVTVVRLLLRPGTRFEEQRERFRPFNRIAEPDPQMRQDVIDLVRASTRARRDVYVLVNNKAEGSAPLTIRALAERLAEEGY